MIKTIILDIGQVLADFYWRGYLEDCGYDELTIQKVSKATVLSEYWREVDRGSKSDEELALLCCALDSSVTNEIMELFQNIPKLVREYDYSADFIKGLKKNGYKVYLLSNYGRTGFEYLKEHYDFINYVDGGVISYEVNYLKPEPEIYQTLIDKYNINPKESVFLDDVQANLDGASRFGIHTIKVTEFSKALKELQNLGVII